MSSLTNMTDDNIFELFNSENISKYIKEQLKIAPKVQIGDCCINLEIEDDNDMDFFMQMAKEDLRETPEIVAQGIKELKELLAGEPDLHIIHSDEFYRIFLRRCKWYAQSAFSLIKRYFHFCQDYSYIFNELWPSKQKEIFCSALVHPLPLRGKDGCRIFVLKLGKYWKPKEVSLDQIFKGLLLNMQAGMLEQKTQIAGGRIILDFEGLSLSQVTYFTPGYAKMLVDFVQKALPIRLKSFHIVNQPFIFNMVFALFKPLLEEKLRKRIYFHGTDVESLMTFIDKSVLLKKHGGVLEITDTSFGMKYWQLFSTFDKLFAILTRLGYPNKK